MTVLDQRGSKRSERSVVSLSKSCPVWRSSLCMIFVVAWSTLDPRLAMPKLFINHFSIVPRHHGRMNASTKIISEVQFLLAKAHVRDVSYASVSRASCCRSMSQVLRKKRIVYSCVVADVCSWEQRESREMRLAFDYTRGVDQAWRFLVLRHRGCPSSQVF